MNALYYSILFTTSLCIIWYKRVWLWRWLNYVYHFALQPKTRMLVYVKLLTTKTANLSNLPWDRAVHDTQRLGEGYAEAVPRNVKDRESMQLQSWKRSITETSLYSLWAVKYVESKRWIGCKRYLIKHATYYYTCTCTSLYLLCTN